MIVEPLGRVLEATGYLADGAAAAPSVVTPPASVIPMRRSEPPRRTS